MGDSLSTFIQLSPLFSAVFRVKKGGVGNVWVYSGLRANLGSEAHSQMAEPGSPDWRSWGMRRGVLRTHGGQGWRGRDSLEPE